MRDNWNSPKVHATEETWGESPQYTDSQQTVYTKRAPAISKYGPPKRPSEQRRLNTPATKGRDGKGRKATEDHAPKAPDPEQQQSVHEISSEETD